MSGTPDTTVSNRRSVLLVAPSMDILGGQAVQAARLLTDLRREACVDIKFQPTNPRPAKALRFVRRIKYVRTVYTFLQFLYEFAWAAKGADCVHVFSPSYSAFLLAPAPAILFCRLLHRRVILNYHSGEADDHLARSWLARRLSKMADVVVVPSDYLVEVFEKHGVKAIAIANTVDVAQFAFKERDALRPIFLSNRNLEKHYGIDLTLRAFSLIQGEVPSATLTIVGEGSQRHYLEELAVSLGLENVFFRGSVQQADMPEVYREHDIFLNSSLIDNMPLSIIEAFAAGLPVISYETGGIGLMVNHGVTGLLCTPRDFGELASQALACLADQSSALRMVQSARAECGKYGWSSVRKQWLLAYGADSAAQARNEPAEWRI